MSVAVRLRCSCRRTLATLEHGSDEFVVSKREQLGSLHVGEGRPLAGTPFTAPAPVTAHLPGFPVAAGLAGVHLHCSRCVEYRTFPADELATAIARARVTGKAVDIMRHPDFGG